MTDIANECRASSTRWALAANKFSGEFELSGKPVDIASTADACVAAQSVEHSAARAEDPRAARLRL